MAARPLVLLGGEADPRARAAASGLRPPPGRACGGTGEAAIPVRVKYEMVV